MHTADKHRCTAECGCSIRGMCSREVATVHAPWLLHIYECIATIMEVYISGIYHGVDPLLSSKMQYGNGAWHSR